ncbi:hypothetical protein MBLNU230_g2552t1 [Neophaeotheca triangularis]
MALKRKRASPSDCPSSPSHTSTAPTDSPLGQFYHQSKPTESIYREKPTWGFPTYSSPPPEEHSDLNSRTRKRHRDNRPEEMEVYASTMQKLYEAQRTQHSNQNPPSQIQPPPTIQHTYEHSSNQPQRSNLHSFWQISRPPPSQNMPAMAATVESTLGTLEARCEDCEGPLRYGDAMEIDGTGNGQQNTLCAGCSRQVCDGCAMSGNERICWVCSAGVGFAR